MESAIKSQQPDGYFGPAKDYSPEPGMQRDNSHDWWPKMVMLKVLKQYYSATNDKRVITLMTNYFKYQLKELPAYPLDHWSFWARYRAGDNLMVVYWLYNITGDKFLLDLADLLHKQTFDYTNAFLNTDMLAQMGSFHGVNLAEGMKEPITYYQQHPEQKFWDATVRGYQDLRKYDEMAHGLFGADESLHGNDPVQGSELCTAVEMMFTLENTLAITGDVNYADRLEKIAFNALPAQVDSTFTNRQYFQQANQVLVSAHPRNFNVDHDGTDVCFGLQSGYSCCTSNMHQGWPKFAQNLWYATPDHGLAALVYSASEVNALVADGRQVSFKEETNYPFDETIKFTLSTGKKKAPVSFPLSLRIPQWCTMASVKINGKDYQQAKGNQNIKITREWQAGDVVELTLPMHVFKNTWFANSMSVERGPITYALKIGEEIKHITGVKDSIDYGSSYYEVHPTTPWNYGLLATDDNKLADDYKVETTRKLSKYPWTLNNSPVIIKTKGKRIPSWQLYNETAGPMPFILFGLEVGKTEDITLVPYGCTELRISQFPVVNR